MKIWVLAKKENFKSYENTRFIKEIKKMKVQCELVSPEEFDILVSKKGEKSILRNGSPVVVPDCLIPRMGSGTTYFALAILRHLEKLNIFVLNNSQSIEIAKDKLATLQILASNNIPIPKTLLAKFPLNISYIEQEFSYPLIIKTVSGSQGKGVFLCENKTQLEDLLDLIEVSKDSKVNLIIQEFIYGSKGKDIRVVVVGGRAIGSMLRIAQEGKFKANFSAGGSVDSFPLDPALEWLAVESAKLINLDIAGVDLLFDGDTYKVCEVNSSPGFKGFEKAVDINVPMEIYKYIQLRLQGTF